MGEQKQRPVAAFVLSLLAGIWMVGAGIVMYPWADWGSWMWGHGMMGGHFGGVRLPWLGLVFGIVVLLGAAILYARPRVARAWGIVILVASAVNLLFGMGGLIASLLGIAGGVLAIAWVPRGEGEGG